MTALQRENTTLYNDKKLKILQVQTATVFFVNDRKKYFLLIHTK